jgi:hypothetical protein
MIFARCRKIEIKLENLITFEKFLAELDSVLEMVELNGRVVLLFRNTKPMGTYSQTLLFRTRIILYTKRCGSFCLKKMTISCMQPTWRTRFMREDYM